MRAKVILNPGSGDGRASHLHPRIVDLFSPYARADAFVTERPRHATELAQAAAAEGYDVVVAVGGDGTVHEVVNGLVRGGRATLPLGVLPVGTGNDFAWGLGMAAEPEEAVRRIFEGQQRTVDLGYIVDDRGRGELFQNNLGIGFDASVVIRTESFRHLNGFPMYLAAVLQSIIRNFQTPRLEMRFDDEQVVQRALFLALGNGPRGGGGFLMVPDAKFDDGMLDSCLANAVGRVTMLSMLTRVMKGTHVTSPHVTIRRNRRFAIKSDLPMPIHLDGEMFAYPRDNVHEVTISTLAAALDVMV